MLYLCCVYMQKNRQMRVKIIFTLGNNMNQFVFLFKAKI